MNDEFVALKRFGEPVLCVNDLSGISKCERNNANPKRIPGKCTTLP
jgi:hypothetical protein